MELSKKNILSLIEKNKKKDFKIINLNIFGNEILLDIETNNPTLQSKKNIENSIKEIISENFIEKVELKINFKVEKTESPQNQIKGNPIKGIQNVIRKKIFDNTIVYHISRIPLILASLIFTLNVWNNAIVCFNTRQLEKRTRRQIRWN